MEGKRWGQNGIEREIRAGIEKEQMRTELNWKETDESRAEEEIRTEEQKLPRKKCAKGTDRRMDWIIYSNKVLLRSDVDKYRRSDSNLNIQWLSNGDHLSIKI